jgi:para-nitrobenzyl esterase
VYAAEFNDPRSPNVSRVHAPGVPQTSAHATDLPYLFDLGGRSLLTNPASHSLARTMVAYWTSFARTGHPVAPGEPKWPRLTPASSVVQGLDASGIKRIDLGDEHQCAFWRTVNPQDR